MFQTFYLAYELASHHFLKKQKFLQLSKSLDFPYQINVYDMIFMVIVAVKLLILVYSAKNHILVSTIKSFIHDTCSCFLSKNKWLVFIRNIKFHIFFLSLNSFLIFKKMLFFCNVIFFKFFHFFMVFH